MESIKIQSPRLITGRSVSQNVVYGRLDLMKFMTRATRLKYSDDKWREAYNNNRYLMAEANEQAERTLFLFSCRFILRGM